MRIGRSRSVASERVVAGVDLGSNSFHMVVARVEEDGRVRHYRNSPCLRKMWEIRPSAGWPDGAQLSLVPRFPPVGSSLLSEDLGPLHSVDDEDFDRLLEIDGIIPAPYAARFGWVKVQRRGVLKLGEAKELIRKSYELVFAKLPKRVQREILV